MAKYMRHIGVANAPLSMPALKSLTTALKENAKAIEKNKSLGCTHFLGYLKTRPKYSSVPDECLTCHRMLKCR